MRTKPKTILVDLDEVVFDWVNPFVSTSEAKGFAPQDNTQQTVSRWFGVDDVTAEKLVDDFNMSETFGRLRSYHSANVVIPALKEQGFSLVAITASGTHSRKVGLRTANIRSALPGCFDLVHVVDKSADKYPYLASYRDSGVVWVEDTKANAVMGRDLGLTSILIDKTYNKGETEGVRRVRDWFDIAAIIQSTY